MRAALSVAAVFAVALVLSSCSSGREEVSGPPLSAEAQQGKTLANQSCLGCHSTNGSASSGPTWKGLAGSTVKLKDGRTVVVDDAYLTRAINDPGVELRAGYPDTMTYAVTPGSLTEEQVRQLVSYIQAVK